MASKHSPRKRTPISDPRVRVPSSSSPPPSFGLVSDASCRGNSNSKKHEGYFYGRVEWRVRDLATGEFVRSSHVQEQSTGPIGETLGLITALRYLHEKGDHITPVYCDNTTAIEWVQARMCRSKLPLNFKTAPTITDLNRAFDWLRENKPRNPVFKWRTEAWGENPADFNRK